MRRVESIRVLPGPLEAVEACWLDTSGWPEFVDGLDRVVAVEGDWPQPGSIVIWESAPRGRGTVTENVIGYEPGAGLTLEVGDASIAGRQTVVFSDGDDGVEVALALEYGILNRNPSTPIIDFLFVRPAMRTMLESTLSRFAAHYERPARSEPS